MEYNPSKFDKLIPEIPEPPKRQWPKRKLWKIAKNTTMGKLNATRNMLKEIHFKKIRTEVRRLYAQHNEYFYDKDERDDYTESVAVMHTLACSSFYMMLDCDFCYQYTITYNIDSSPFKAEIDELIHRGPLHDASNTIIYEPSMTAYFEHMRTYWKDNPLHFSYLNEAEQPL